jgi:hypothetical protein
MGPQSHLERPPGGQNSAQSDVNQVSLAVGGKLDAVLLNLGRAIA